MHSCDHRSDFQCPACAQDQVDHERMVEARGAANPQTIRGEIEWIRNNPWAPPAEIAEHAVAALDLLGQSKRAGLHHTSTYRLVLDPAPRGDADA